MNKIISIEEFRRELWDSFILACIQAEYDYVCSAWENEGGKCSENPMEYIHY